MIREYQGVWWGGRGSVEIFLINSVTRKGGGDIEYSTDLSIQQSPL